MLFKNISFPDPEKNILYDELLLELAEKGELPAVLRIWESKFIFVVLGRICKAEEDVYLDRVRVDDVPILRRASGGGTVLQGPGCLNFTLILPKNDHPALGDIKKSYVYILQKVINVLKKCSIESTFYPICDLALTRDQKKFSGNAQKRGKNFILHHGTILYNFKIPLIEKYLRMPSQVPDYRKGRTHKEFITNLYVNRYQVIDAFKKEFKVIEEETEISAKENELLNQSVLKKQIYINF